MTEETGEISLFFHEVILGVDVLFCKDEFDLLKLVN